ncbi:uncharacterized protein LOC125201288 [Salvia hispanica]|uniref:uncharacterized protein LOC125201288 n=1 Tax=Salvia hispanica TaxID=49212 RepID=UPI0020096549|nr:uncharacterized protein LOC125201288 [Salvia hispanica]XP_047955303.1 uncharacterized protein LOC125201288 [Salvia hispanica]
MADQYDPGCFGVRLANREQREKWDTLVQLKVIPSRYPDEEALEALGLGDCFWELSRMGGLTKMFKGKWSSYRHLTLEFLSTLKVTRVGIIPRIQEIKFRLGNVDYEMSVEELNHMLECEGIVISMPDKFDMDGFWTAITFLWEGKRVGYSEGRAKSISIRNPVLRYLQMACSFLPFARSQTKGVASSELFLLWNILNRRALNMGSFIISHLQSQARKTSGTLACGGIITAIAELCKINTKRLEPMKDKGEMFLSFEVLKEIELITVDSRQRFFFIQEAGDHFPLPNPSYTYVHGWHITQNWRLDSDAHKAIVKAMPAHVPLNPQYRPGIPFQSNLQPLRPDPVLLPHQAPPQEEHAHDDQGPSQQRRTRRRTGPQHADDVSLAERVDHLGTRIDHVEASMRQHLEQLNQRFDHYHKVNDERWGRVENTVGEMLRRFQTLPNPLPPPSQ